MDVLSDKFVKLSKSCHCWGCGREFKAGETIRKTTSVDNGEFFCGNWCKVCDAYWTEYLDDSDVINYGDLLSNDPDGWKKIESEINANPKTKIGD